MRVGLLTLFVALAVWGIGLFVADQRCTSLIHELRGETMGLRTGEHGLCEVYVVNDGTVVEQYDRDDWDFTEVALVLAGLGAGLLVGPPRGRSSAS